MRRCKRRDPIEYPLRTARTQCPCRGCAIDILPGHRYRDGGQLRWFHEFCALSESLIREAGGEIPRTRESEL